MFLFGAIVAIPVFILGSRPARVATRALLSIEGITVALIIVVAVVVLIKILAGSTPADQSFTLSVFNPPAAWAPTRSRSGSSSDSSRSPASRPRRRSARRRASRAMTSRARSSGPRSSAASSTSSSRRSRSWASARTRPASTAFAASGALFQTLSSMYLTSWIGDIITVGIIFSAAACALACFVAASRLAYALARDAFPRSSVAALSSATTRPWSRSPWSWPRRSSSGSSTASSRATTARRTRTRSTSTPRRPARSRCSSPTRWSRSARSGSSSWAGPGALRPGRS